MIEVLCKQITLRVHISTQAICLATMAACAQKLSVKHGLSARAGTTLQEYKTGTLVPFKQLQVCAVVAPEPHLLQRHCPQHRPQQVGPIGSSGPAASQPVCIAQRTSSLLLCSGALRMLLPQLALTPRTIACAVSLHVNAKRSASAESGGEAWATAGALQTL